MSLSTVAILYLVFYTCSQSHIDAAKEGEIFGAPTLKLTRRLPKGKPCTARTKLELVADWRVACGEEDLVALLPPYSIVVVVGVERKGISVPIAHLYSRACRNYYRLLHHYIIT